MPFDNEAFTRWLQDFEKVMIDSGIPQPQAMRYRTDFYDDALAHFAAGRTPEDAAVVEIIGPF